MFYRSLIMSFAMCFLVTNLSAGEDDQKDAESKISEFDKSVAFVEKHLIGKTLYTSTKTKIADGDIETEFERKTHFLQLVKTKTTVTFDLVGLIRQSLWDLDKDGNRVSKKPRVENRAYVLRYSFDKLKTSGEAIGTSSTLTAKDGPFATGYAAKLNFKDGSLILYTTTPLYSEGFAKNGGYQRVAFSGTQKFVLKKGKLTATTQEELFRVDPKTMKRTQMKHDVVLKETEIDGLF